MKTELIHLIEKGYASESDIVKMKEFITEHLGVITTSDEVNEEIICRAYTLQIAAGKGDILKATVNVEAAPGNEREKALHGVAWKVWQILYNHQAGAETIQAAIHKGFRTAEEMEEARQTVRAANPDLHYMEVEAVVASVVRIQVEKKQLEEMFARAEEWKTPE